MRRAGALHASAWIAAGVLVVALMAPAALAADKAPEKGARKLEDVENALESGRQKEGALSREAEALAKEIESLRAKSVESARAAQDREEAISALERRLQKLSAELAHRTAALGSQRVQLVRLLGALERIALRPPDMLIAMPATPNDTVRSALLLRTAIPSVQTRSQELQLELNELAQLRADIAARREELTAALESLKGERKQLEHTVEQKARLAAATEEQRAALAKRNARLAAEAKDLRDLLERLESARAKAPPPKPQAPVARNAPAERQVVLIPPQPQAGAARSFGNAQGQLLLPVRGQIVRSFGQEGNGGVADKGITIETRPDAQVVAPYDGQVAFSGPFRGYGHILIIDHGEGYHTLLMGLSRIDGVEGQWVVAGEPIGLMGHSESGKPALYVELRRNGRPINPLPWLSARNDKAGG
ncbi:MAG: peptidoglycan DD-metalloendopeptidase family protein [Alphaproteobacteria bacterium]